MKVLLVLLFLFSVSFSKDLDVVQYYTGYSHPSVYLISSKNYYLDKNNSYTRLQKEEKPEKENKPIVRQQIYFSKLPQ